MVKKLVNNYIPEYVPSNLPWDERDGLMTYIDQLKYQEFIEDTDNLLRIHYYYLTTDTEETCFVYQKLFQT